eukprot:3847979-Amphidinium_carterae.1
MAMSSGDTNGTGMTKVLLTHRNPFKSQCIQTPTHCCSLCLPDGFLPLSPQQGTGQTKQKRIVVD